MKKTIVERYTLDTVCEAGQDNLILINKPADWTSFDVVKKVRGIGRFKKVGHGGTLDPFATGLLILGTGKLTRELKEISGSRKSYEATIKFGQSTDSFDLTGEVTGNSGVAKLDEQLINKTIASFLGESLQVPPMYSAKKVNGVRLYKMARKGKVVERKPSPITIFEIEIARISGLEADIYVSCSKGTYIRALAHDIGQKCGYLAHLSALKRTQIGDYELSQAIEISEFEKWWKAVDKVDASIPGA